MSIEVKNISSVYAEKTPFEISALKDISFRIDDGEFVGIMGQTGSGKSTLIQLIAGLLKPSKGQIFINGADINATNYDRTVLQKTIGIVFQYPEYQLFEATVEKDVAFALKYSGLTKTEVEERVKWALEILGFSYENIRNKSPLSLSGGEKRRVAIAGVLASRPSVLIFDEPLAGLDSYSRQAFIKLVEKLNCEGTTILMISHNADCICEYADRILILKEGKLVADGTPNEVFEDIDYTKTLHIGAGNVRSIAQSLYQRGLVSSPVITKYQILIDEIKATLKEGGSL